MQQPADPNHDGVTRDAQPDDLNDVFENPGEYDLRVVYRDVTDDLPNGRKELGDEEAVELVEFEPRRNDDGEIIKIVGRTADGVDVITPHPHSHKCSVRARHADQGTYNRNLGWVQRLQVVEAG